MSRRYQAGIVLPGYNALKVANAPTIGTATAGTANCASVTFTAPACVGGGAISSYSAFCTTTGNNKTSGASSPLVVTGLTAASSYTFKVVATNAFGPSYPSGASNSITATIKTCCTFTTAGSYTWVAPTGVISVAVVAIGAGGKSNVSATGLRSGSGGGLGYKNNISVTPGNSYTVVVGATAVTAGSSYFCSTSVVRGGGGAYSSSSPQAGGTYTGDGGGNGGYAGAGYSAGGAGGYSGNGGNGTSCGTGGSGSGGGGGGGGAIVYPSTCCQYGGAGGGVGIFGQGSNGAGGTTASTIAYGGGGGSSGSNGSNSNPTTPPRGGVYGGGGGSRASNTTSNCGAVGAVRIVWCSGGARGTPSFPSTNVGP